MPPPVRRGPGTRVPLMRFTTTEPKPAMQQKRVARVLFLGGNGHSEERLDPARRALEALPETQQLELRAIRYPGFEGRPRAASFEELLDATERDLDLADSSGQGVVYATGIGALVALALRARATSPQRRLILQGGVLWGLEERLFPKLMRGPMPHLLRAAFNTRLVQARFVRKHFRRTPSAEERADFFRGYARCGSFADLFRWLDAGLLRSLERSFAARPAALSDIEVWWGERDSVVGLAELERTQQILDTNWRVQTFPEWGHYPMLDVPGEWVQALADALATSARG